MMKFQVRYFWYQTSSQFSGVFSGLLAAAIDHMEVIGGRPAWAWIFVLVHLKCFRISCNPE